MKRWKAVVSVIMVFLLGGLAGALVTHGIYHAKIEKVMRGEGGMTREYIVNRLNRELNLDKTQLDQVRTIVQDTHAQMRTVRSQYRPQMEEILKRSQDRVRTVLRPDQVEKFDKIIAERRKRHEEDNGK